MVVHSHILCYNIDMDKTCCCVGHNPQCFPFRYGCDGQKHAEYLFRLLNKIELAVSGYGITRFISGLGLGAELDFAELVLALRGAYGIALGCVPYRGQTENYKPRDRARYENIMKKADFNIDIFQSGAPDSDMMRLRYIVDNSDLVIGVYSGVLRKGKRYALNYAYITGKPVELIDLREVL